MPLEGIRVCDLSWVITGPYCTQIMAEMGAEVIRIESQQRLDNYRDARTWPRGWADKVPGVNRGGTFNSCNLSKMSCTLDLTRPEGLALARSIAKVSDVVVESFGTGVAERLGLSYASMKEIRPDIIMLSSSVLGRTGPDREHLGMGPVLIGLTGLQAITGYPGGRPSRIGGTWPDFMSALAAATAILFALHHRRRTGEGQYIDLALSETTISLMPEPIMDYVLNGRVWRGTGNRDPRHAPQGVYPCQGEDKWVAIAVSSEEEWHALARALGRPEWLADPRFANEERRRQNQDELDMLISRWTKERMPYEAMKTLQEAGVPAGPSLNNQDLVAEPHLAERDFFARVDHPEVGERVYVGLPWKFTPALSPRYEHAPLLGQHNGYVLEELLGLPSSEVRRLTDEGVVR